MSQTTIGRVITVNHPLVTIEGLSEVQPGAVLTIGENTLAVVTGFTEVAVEAMVFDTTPVAIGAHVKLTHQALKVPVSTQLLGHVINPLGVSLDGLDVPEVTEHQLTDADPLSLPNRARITDQCLTGVGTVDLLLPLGKGQRELVVGDHKAGKSTFLEQAATTQAQQGSVVIWAAIGQIASDVKRLVNQLSETKILDKSILIATTAQDSASLIYLTPFTAMTLAEYFRDQGLDVLVILDDLTTHARCHREIALLGKRFPGRDSYPGDVFYTHARLLERAGSFIHPIRPNSTVTITCLPVAETTESDLTSYIVSNLISITDGHLLFDTELFSQGQRPAIHTGLSVTRVGKQTQSRLQRELNRELTAFFAEYNRTQKLTHFGAELTSATQDILHKGQTLLNFLHQDAETMLTPEVTIIGALLIWLGWWIQIETSEVVKQRQELTKRSQQAKYRQLIESLFAEPDLKAVVTTMHAHRSELEQLCHV